ncbi:NfeD family protein [Paraferrimonas sp. SM1919]|uniref:NfeD family protein n=1 Tax=Paraferrimonas sp. SM1919 TaxID=2662263 RepID=UPI0013D49E87|nr:NfeD family protein [Paraferrimonas sp. SM1919]
MMTPFYFFLILAIALIAIELMVFQLSIFWLLFIGLGALITSLVLTSMEMSWLPSTVVFVGSTVIISLLLYRPLKRWQDKPSKLPGHDAIGQSVQVLETVSATGGKVRWSGVDWAAKLVDADQTPIEPGTSATIVEMSGIELKVK